MMERYHRHELMGLGLLLIIMIAALLSGGATIEGQEGRLLVNAASGLFLVVFACLCLPDRRWLLLLLIGLPVLAHLLQLIPLPPWLWTNLPSRLTITQEIDLLGLEAGWRPLSLAPHDTVASLAGLMPGLLALVVAFSISRAGGYLIAVLILIFCIVNALWGFVQVFSGNDPLFYLWDFTSRGLPTGAFANVNHQATLMLCGLPALACLLRYARSRSGWYVQGPGPWICATAVLFLLIACLIAAGSVAGYMIALPILVLSGLLMMRGGQGKLKTAAQIVGAVSAIGLVFTLIFTSPQLPGLGVTSFEESSLSRRGINRVSGEMLSDHKFTGTGAGSYSEIYAMYENPDLVTSTYVKHAHNDYFQILIEFGILGAILLLAGLGLIFWQSFRIWFGPRTHQDTLARAASIIVLVFLLHSLVDYPARTQLGLIALCLGLGLLFGQSSKPDSGANAAPNPDTSVRFKSI